MTAVEGRAKTGRAIGEFAEWLHLPVTLWVLHSSSGPAAVAGFLVLASAGRVVMKRRTRVAALMAPAALGALALLDLRGTEVSLPVAWLTGLLVGSGSGASGRTVALLAAVRFKPGPAAPLGAGVALVGSRLLEPEILLASAAAAMLLATAFGEGESDIGAVPASLTWGAAAAAFCVGLRVLEPSLASSVTEGALFSLAWAVGLRFSASRSHRADARAVIAAVFGSAAASAFLSLAEAWSAVFVMLGLAAAVGLVCGAGAGASDAGRGLLSGAAAAGCLWTAAAGYPTATLGAAVVALGGGLIVWRSAVRARPLAEKAAPPISSEEPARVPAPRKVAQGPPDTPPAPVHATGPSEPSPLDRRLEAAAVLLEATRQARRIRSEALRAFRSSAPATGARFRAVEVLDETVEAAAQARRRLSAIRW